MKPVAILRFSRTEGPGHFATFLSGKAVPYCLIKIDSGEVVSADIDSYSGFSFMGGPMSANDELPWIPPVLELIRHAVAAGLPCIGHCLGGQLMAKALGAEVTTNPVKEIGWYRIGAESNEVARHWLGDVVEFTTFQWHGETFALPPGATRILTGPHCANQAYVIGPHLGMQCHVEMTAEMVRNWCEDGALEIARALSAGQNTTVMEPATIQAQMETGLANLNRVANQLYEKWLAGLKRVA